MSANFSRTMAPTSQKRRRPRLFTLVEILVCTAILGILIAILVPVLHRALEYAREAYCMNNLHQIAIGYHQYLIDHDTETPLPESGFFLDDLSPAIPYVKMLDVFTCPSTGTAPFTAADEMANGGDYLVTMFKEWRDIELATSQWNHGHGNNIYGLDPSNPAFVKKGGMSLFAQFENGVVYENHIGNHFPGYRNVLYIGDAHYEKIHTSNNKKFIRLVPGSMCGRRVEKFW